SSSGSLTLSMDSSVLRSALISDGKSMVATRFKVTRPGAPSASSGPVRARQRGRRSVLRVARRAGPARARRRGLGRGGLLAALVARLGEHRLEALTAAPAVVADADDEHDDDRDEQELGPRHGPRRDRD